MKVIFEANKLAIAYIMQVKGIRNFGISRAEWNKLFRDAHIKQDKTLFNEIEKECLAAEKLKEIIENEWRQNEKNVLAWLMELTRVDFKEPIAKVCVVPFSAGQTPFRNIPLIIVGKIRVGWGYPETIAHELAHVLFNQNFDFKSEVEHPYVQLIEEEIAVRLGARSKYFDYEIPAFAEWVLKAQKMEKNWRHYLQHIEDFNDISQFIKENEETNKRQ